MNAPPNSKPTRALTPGRLVALVLLGVVAAGLAYLGLTGGSSVSVPKDARAGQLTLHSCHYGTERGSYAADCGTLVVRENRHKADSRLIALPVTRVRSLSAHPAAPIFRLQGGPGISNMDFADASRFAGDHDVVLVGYRGVDGSSKLDCPEVASARERANGFLTEKAYRADEAAFKACARRLQDDGVDLAGYSLPERVDDLESARRALGYGKIDLISESAGTRTAMIYAWRYPKSIHRSVMIAVNPPGHFLWDARTTGEQIRRYAALCTKDASCRERTPDLAASLSSAFGNIPSRWWFLPIRKGNVRAAAFFGLMNATSEAAPLSGPQTIDTMVDAGQGDGSGAWLLSMMAQLVFPKVQVWGDVASVGRADAAYARRFFAAGADRGSVMGAPLTDMIWVGGRLLDAWPANPDENQYTRVQDSSVETLLIGGPLDFATPPQNATRELLPHLPNGRQVLLPGLGHSDDFWGYEPKASAHLVNTYLATGKVDTSRYTFRPVDFTPSFSQGKIAKITLASMLGVAGLAALLLLWLPLKRGRMGWKTRMAVRSLFVVVLGLGGWFVGVFVALAWFPTVPLLSDLLVALSVGLPVGLGIHSAWIRREWSSRTKWTGLAAGLVGALVGAWLGFHAMAAVFAVLTAIIGATVGANLVLLGLDILRERSARKPAPTARASAVASAEV